MTIYLDMDGVLCDFDGGLKRHGVMRNETSFIHKDKKFWTPDQIALDIEVRGVMAKPNFFRNLSWVQGAAMLYEWVKPLDPFILTARPFSTEWSDRISDEKKSWVQENLGDIQTSRFICCLRSEKQEYAATDGIPNVLVDDIDRNCWEWEQAGGVAIQFKNAEQALEDLKKIVNC